MRSGLHFTEPSVQKRAGAWFPKLWPSKSTPAVLPGCSLSSPQGNHRFCTIFGTGGEKEKTPSVRKGVRNGLARTLAIT